MFVCATCVVCENVYVCICLCVHFDMCVCVHACVTVSAIFTCPCLRRSLHLWWMLDAHGGPRQLQFCAKLSVLLGSVSRHSIGVVLSHPLH